MRKEREADQSGRGDTRSYERRTDYGRLEKSHGPIREYGGVSTGGTQSYYPSETIAVAEDSR